LAEPAEYRNAIRDLLSLDIDAAALLPPDESDEGFDNVAASLALAPAHLERYLAAAREISRQAVGDAALGQVPASFTYRVPKLLEQDVRLGDDLPFGPRGGLAVRHHFPLDDFSIPGEGPGRAGGLAANREPPDADDVIVDLAAKPNPEGVLAEITRSHYFPNLCGICSGPGDWRRSPDVITSMP
jgi:hypothetical protein